MLERATSRKTLTERDLAVVLDIYKYRYLTAPQIQRLHFPSLQTTYRRIRSLSSQGFITGFSAPNIAEHLYHLDTKGVDLAAQALGVEVSNLKWSRMNRAPKDYYFLRHFLELNDFRITLTLACRTAPLSLLGFIPEYFGEKTQDGRTSKYIKDFVCDITDHNRSLNHTPDAVFALAKNEVPALFFLEIDRGTEVVGDPDKGVMKAIRFYLNYLLSEQYQRYKEDFGCTPFKGFRALIVTTAAARIENIRQAASALSYDTRAKRFIWLTETKHVHTTSPFEPIWLSADTGDATRYRIG